jgi:hypothetical protein
LPLTGAPPPFAEVPPVLVALEPPPPPLLVPVAPLPVSRGVPSVPNPSDEQLTKNATARPAAQMFTIPLKFMVREYYLVFAT